MCPDPKGQRSLLLMVTVLKNPRMEEVVMTKNCSLSKMMTVTMYHHLNQQF